MFECFCATQAHTHTHVPWLLAQQLPTLVEYFISFHFIARIAVFGRFVVGFLFRSASASLSGGGDAIHPSTHPSLHIMYLWQKALTCSSISTTRRPPARRRLIWNVKPCSRSLLKNRLFELFIILVLLRLYLPCEGAPRSLACCCCC